jgi:hypothetical protein
MPKDLCSGTVQTSAPVTCPRSSRCEEGSRVADSGSPYEGLPHQPRETTTSNMPRPLGSSRRCTCGVAVAVLTLAAPVLSGCFPLAGTSPKELRTEAAALIPPGSRVIEQHDGDCVEFEHSPSCRLIYFIASRKATATLAREVEKAAGRRGWSLQRKDVREGGTALRFKRPGLDAYVGLIGRAGTEACRHRPRKDCASLIDVSVD